MPLDKSIKKTLVIGSGPIVIGQAAEFDYAGTQACRMLKEDGIEIVLVNSNPATIMTDNKMADHIYLEPLTLQTIKRIIEKEKPDSILSGLGGQTGLTLCMQLAKDGFLEKHGVRLLGSSPETIDKAEDRQMFKDTMEAIGEPVIPSIVTTDLQGALDFAASNGYPVIIRPAFTLGGSGGGIAHDEAELREIAENGLSLSPIHQVLVERCIAGWKEIEFEVMRDRAGNCITVCSMENFDPVGVHTGDSIVIAPAVTLADREYQMLRTAALNIIDALGVEGGCNCQFALNPDSFEYAVIEVNPRVSRSSALASKATGYPIAKVATKIAIGYTLDEIKNAVTGTTYAAFEPALDYVAVKFPKWPFDKFVYAKRDLGTQMKATGEVMSIADTFELALMKAVRGAEVGLDTLTMPKLAQLSDEEVRAALHKVTDERLFVVYEALKRGVTTREIHDLTKIDLWFLENLVNILEVERALTKGAPSRELLLKAKRFGFTDAAIARLSGATLCEDTRVTALELSKMASLPTPDGSFPRVRPTYKMVDTCAGEFAAATPYFYATMLAGEDEAAAHADTGNKRIVVIGSGPIRIGQGIEFDYASVHCVRALRKLGYDVVVINNNPETVSTDFDTADRLYFEPLNIEDVMGVIELEKPEGVIVAFGGGTAIKLANALTDRGVKIIGSSADTIDLCEDRERFDELLETIGVARPAGHTATNEAEALAAANALSYPVLMRPSYVLGGQNMIIAFSDKDIKEYMEIILRQKQTGPVLIDKYLSGREIEVDAICDGHDILIPGIMEHVERTGIHSGDSIAIYPAPRIEDDLTARIVKVTEQICAGIHAVGLVNLQYILMDDQIYVIEVNPRASRTVPYMSKVTGIQMCDLAVQVSLGQSLRELGCGTGLAKQPPYTAVKVPVFSFEKLSDVDTQLGPEMKSTGEVLGLSKNLDEALYKGLLAAGYKLEREGGVFLTVRNSDKGEIAPIAKKFHRLGYALYATGGTADVLKAAGLPVIRVNKIHENPDDNTMTLLESGKLAYIISTSTKGRDPARDSVKIRRKASLLGIPCLTSIDTANALADSLSSGYSEINTELVDINNMRSERQPLKFTKMQCSGNDYIYIDSLDTEINSPESLSVTLADRHYGIGGDGVVLYEKSDRADVKIRMFNLDGSEGLMCGTAACCISKLLFDRGIIRGTHLTVETATGVRAAEVTTKNGFASSVKVDMGSAVLTPGEVPVDTARLAEVSRGESLLKDAIVGQKVAVADGEYEITCLSVGNPHCVTFVAEPDTLNLAELGPKFEHDPLFPQRVNTEFVQVVDRHTLKMRVFERGSGETLACGTGACAAAVAAILCGHCDANGDIRVLQRGGELRVSYHDGIVRMKGSCQKVFEGVVEV